ncbi:hypothetical protein D9M68_670130 [compost metagenome]
MGGCKRDQGGAHAHQHDGRHHGGLSTLAVRVGAQHHAAQRPHDEAHAEDSDRHQQRAVVGFAWEVQLADHRGEKAVNREIENLQPVAKAGAHDRPSIACPAIERCLDGPVCRYCRRFHGFPFIRFAAISALDLVYTILDKSSMNAT